MAAHPEDVLLPVLLLLTKDRGVGVYDIHLSRLYDPRGHVKAEVSLCDELTLPYLTPALLRDLVLRPFWPDPENPFVIIARAGQDYIQTYRNPDGSYQLEYRDGGPGSHFEFPTRDSALVADIMWAWTTQDPRWRTAVAWRALDLGDGNEAPSGQKDPSIHLVRNLYRQSAGAQVTRIANARPSSSRLTLIRGSLAVVDREPEVEGSSQLDAHVTPEGSVVLPALRLLNN